MCDRNENARERYAMYKAAGICTDCGQNDAEPGITLCTDCAGKKVIRDAARYANRTDEMRLRYNAGQKHRRDEFRTAGLCPACGKRKPVEGGKYCLECRLHYRRKMRERKQLLDLPRSQWVENGFCYVCKAPLKPGFEVCERCYENLVKMRASPGSYQKQQERITVKFRRRRLNGERISCAND